MPRRQREHHSEALAQVPLFHAGDSADCICGEVFGACQGPSTVCFYGRTSPNDAHVLLAMSFVSALAFFSDPYVFCAPAHTNTHIYGHTYTFANTLRHAFRPLFDLAMSASLCSFASRLNSLAFSVVAFLSAPLSAGGIVPLPTYCRNRKVVSLASLHTRGAAATPPGTLPTHHYSTSEATR